MRWILNLFVVVVFSTSIGCFGPSSINAPTYSAAAVADAAMTDYDANKDGKLDEKELERSPALKSSVADLDKDSDKAIAKDELEARLNEFLQSKIGLITASCRVSQGDRPLADAEVKFVPEKFHGEALSVATGKSDKDGVVELRCEGKPHPGLSLGFYRVEVSLKDANGQETIPARFNTQTTLGYQISTRMRGAIEIRIP